MDLRRELADLGARVVASGKRLLARAVEVASAMAARAGPIAARQTRRLRAAWARFRPKAREAAQDLGTRARIWGNALLKACMLAVEGARQSFAAVNERLAGTRARLARTASQIAAALLQAWSAARQHFGTAAASLQDRAATRLRD